MQPDRGRAGAAIEDKANRSRRPVAGVEEIGGREYSRLRLPALVVDPAGDDRNEFRHGMILEGLAVEHDAALALAWIPREELVDFLPHALLRFFGRRGGGLSRFGHEMPCQQ